MSDILLWLFIAAFALPLLYYCLGLVVLLGELAQGIINYFERLFR